MTRKYIDCRQSPSVSNCTVAIAADTDEELLEAAVQHAVSVHGQQDTPECIADSHTITCFQRADAEAAIVFRTGLALNFGQNHVQQWRTSQNG